MSSKLSLSRWWLPQLPVKTAHQKMMALGLLAFCCYLPAWLADIGQGIIKGQSNPVMLAPLGLAAWQIWQGRAGLAKVTVPMADRYLGYLLLFFGMACVPFGFDAEWKQRVIWLLLAVSAWGLQLFVQRPWAVALVVLGLFPHPGAVSSVLLNSFLIGEGGIETIMARVGTWGLTLIGQPAVQSAHYITLAGKAVRVNWGCSGFDIACVVGIGGLLFGLAMRQSWRRIVMMVGMGMVLALGINVPRIMLMTMANSYWSEASFHFWHEGWGSQIFMSVVFTVYYYVVMGMVRRQREVL